MILAVSGIYGLKTTFTVNRAWLMNRKSMAVVRKSKDGVANISGNRIWRQVSLLCCLADLSIKPLICLAQAGKAE